MERGAARGTFVLVLAAAGFSLLLGEIGLRIAFPPHRFLDPQQDCFWTLRLRQAMEGVQDESALWGSGQYDARSGWKPQPDLRLPGCTTNSRGMRGAREYPESKPSRTTRVLVHGDSFTWGLGVRDEETYAHRLESLIPDSEVLNLGVNGHGIDQQYLRWLDEGARHDPDIVLLGFYVPDFHRSTLSVREFPKPRFNVEDGRLRAVGLPVPRVREFLQTRSSGCNAGSRLLALVSAVARAIRPPEPSVAFTEKADLTRAILAAWSASASTANTRFCAVVIPHPRYEAYPEHARIVEIVQTSARKHGFACLDLTTPLRALEESSVQPYSPRHGHWSAEGHALAAREIAAFLQASPRDAELSNARVW